MADTIEKVEALELTEEQAAKKAAKEAKKKAKAEKKEKKPKQEKKHAGSQGSKDEDKITFDADKDTDFPTWFENICVMADIVDKRYPVKGMPVFRPYGFFMHDRIMKLIEAEWEEQGIDRAQFPTVIPEDFLKKEEDHVKGFEAECFWVTKGGLKDLETRLALRPTSETAMYYMFSLWVKSHRDLPLKVQQSCTVFRYETKNTRPLIRAREIFWNEAHTCHATREEARENLEQAWLSYYRLCNDHLGFFGKRLRRPEWDKFAGADYSDVLDSVMPDGKVLQAVGAHNLGQKFAKVFDIKFLNKSQKFEHAYMTCYGISTRILAAAVSAHGDKNGLVLPPSIAKVEVIIVPIVMKKKDREALIAAADEVAVSLKAAGIRAQVDDDDTKPGEKFYKWEMKGVPCRVEIGPRDLLSGEMRVVMRDNNQKDQIQRADAAAELKTRLTEMMDRIRSAAKAKYETSEKTCMTLEEATEWLAQGGGFARIPFFSMEKEAKEADEKIHEATGGEVRGYMPHEEAPAEGTVCAVTGKPAKYWGYVARAY
eukprot:TRINITY_DN33268_c0_g1_i1.p1 TRINITY_DN33268_c0_g1~~TRINITY_DN33268_c0_g1_i1.p1  ORF type:complete len:550 (+),score=237.80 TRINITY_DN33268_c0_g1_i1:32-1651(+)